MGHCFAWQCTIPFPIPARKKLHNKEEISSNRTQSQSDSHVICKESESITEKSKEWKKLNLISQKGKSFTQKWWQVPSWATYGGNGEISALAQSNLNWSVGKKANFDAASSSLSFPGENASLKGIVTRIQRTRAGKMPKMLKKIRKVQTNGKLTPREFGTDSCCSWFDIDLICFLSVKP